MASSLITTKSHSVAIWSFLSLISLLQLVFIILKLYKVIAWNWVIVLIPLIGLLGLPFVTIIITGIVYLFVYCIYSKKVG